MDNCDWCNLSEEDKQFQVYENKSWSVFLSDEQDYYNSAMWGNYADRHKGGCLIYETDEKQSIFVQNRFVKAEKVVYKGEIIERNFFESFGCLTFPQIKKRLTGTDGISCCYDVFRDENKWREQY